ncbi:hypothetical protein D3C86_1602010 [compost metagenome]
MVGELVAQGKTDPIRLAVVADHIETGELRFFAGIFGKRRHREVRAGAHDDAAIALVEPFRLRTDLAGRWFAALQAPSEDAHGVGHAGFDRSVLLVHLVPRRGAAQMGQAGAADQAMGRVFMVEWRQDFALLQQLCVIRARLGAAQGDFFLQAAFAADRGECQFTGVAGALEHLDLCPVDESDLALPVGVFELNQAHAGLQKFRVGAAGLRRLQVTR